MSNMPTPYFNELPRKLTFEAAMALAISDDYQEYLLKRLHGSKQKHIERLIKKQHREYKIIPAMESVAHLSSVSYEEAFIFTLPCIDPKHVYLVYENINVDRATIVCLVEKQEYQYCLKKLYNHMANDMYINKRYELQRHLRKPFRGMIFIKSVKHR